MSDSGKEWTSSQSGAAFVGGVLTGMIASRLLPPLLARASGTAWAAMGRDPFDELIADHRKLVALLTEMEQSQGRGRSNFHRTQLLLRFKRRLAAHALAEEDVAYPLLHDAAKAADDAKHLYAEHADMKIHLHALEQMPKDDPAWTARARALRQLIEEHARQEEEVEFPKLRQALGHQERTRLSGDLSCEKALIL